MNAIMQQVPSSVFEALQKYTPSEDGFGICVGGKGSELDTSQRITDLVIKIADYALPSVIVFFKAVGAFLILIADASEQAPASKKNDANNVPEKSTASTKHIFQLSADQRTYLMAQVARGACVVFIGWQALLIYDVAATLCLPENKSLWTCYNELVPEYFAVRV